MTRLGQAHQEFNRHRKLLYQNRHFQMDKKKELFQSLILSRLLFGSETWTFSDQKTREYLHGGIMSLLKRLCTNLDTVQFLMTKFCTEPECPRLPSCCEPADCVIWVHCLLLVIPLAGGCSIKTENGCHLSLMIFDGSGINFTIVASWATLRPTYPDGWK